MAKNSSKKNKKKGAAGVSDTQLMKFYTDASISMVIDNLKGVPLDEILAKVYVKSKNKVMSDFIKIYEQRFLLGALDEARFKDGLHGFFSENADKIKASGMYKDFLYFSNQIFKALRLHIKDNVVDAYHNLLMQQFAYFGGVNNYMYGVTSDGKMLKVPEIIKGMNDVNKEFLVAAKAGVAPSFKKTQSLLRTSMHEVESMADVEGLGRYEQIWFNCLYAMSYYMDEETKFLFPKKYYNPHSGVMMAERYYSSELLEELKERLSARTSLLPSKGIVCLLDGGSDVGGITRVTLYEKYQDERFVMLYNIEFGNEGEIYGFYEINDKLFYSMWTGSTGDSFIGRPIANLVLELYASLTCSEVRGMGALSMYSTLDQYVNGYELLDDDVTVASTGKRSLNKLEYTAMYKHLNPFFRNLPAGQEASGDARRLAETLGVVIPEGKTIVRDFSRKVYVKKK